MIDRSRVVSSAYVEGRLDLASLGSLVAGMRGAASAGQLVHVVDYSAALVEIAQDDLAGIASNISRMDGATEIPAALIASKAQMALFTDYARIAARSGVITQIFASRESAHQWASTQAVVIQYWNHCYRRLTSP